MRKPNLFLVGAPKCGTTSLAHYLSAHPDVFMADKEPAYLPFVADLHFRLQYHFATSDERRYLAFFRKATTEKWILDATPLYLYSTNAAERIHAFSPEAKIVMILRDPVAMMYSLHGMNLANYNEDLSDFDEALAAEPDRRLGRRMTKYVSLTETVYYRAWVSYTSQVERYFNVFGREKVHVIVFDDFVSDTQSVFEQTLQFLQIDDTFRTDFHVANASAEQSKARAFLSIHPYVRNVVSRLPASLRRVGAKLADPFLPELPQQGKLRAETRNRLLAELEPEVDRLEQLLDRKLINWHPEADIVIVPNSLDPSNSSDAL